MQMDGIAAQARREANLFERLEAGGSQARSYKHNSQARTERDLKIAPTMSRLVRWDYSLRRCGIAFGVVGGAEENNYDGEIHPDHYADRCCQTAVN